ncbi:helix-loop-helix DNA-binding domain-containing protein [Ditylenchus destructor]|uniref:Helix-loop-helix DNA-binding domain-containing protein n=1 Tax=Ditylenchus destructor TaxID=166010 RepID=A0AAD4MIV8_9BILA|nr:helix-loop-helix DNA-binding domain-containing protein [Ditylenchus destructor]
MSIAPSLRRTIPQLQSIFTKFHLFFHDSFMPTSALLVLGYSYMHPSSTLFTPATMDSILEQNSSLFMANQYDTANTLLDCYPTQDLVNQTEIVQLAQKYLSTSSPSSNASSSSSPPNSFLNTTNLFNQNLPSSPITGMNAMNYMQQIFGAASEASNTLSNQLLNFDSSRSLIESVQNRSHLFAQETWLSQYNHAKQEQQSNQYHLENKRRRLEIWSDRQCQLSTNYIVNGIDETLGADRINIPAITEEHESNIRGSILKSLIPCGSKRRKTSIESCSSSSPRSDFVLDNPMHREERKRIVHILAEKNRRNALKEGFEKLVDAIPAVNEGGVRTTSAVVMNRAVKHICHLKAQFEGTEKQISDMKEKIRQLKDEISVVQSNLSSSRHCDNSAKSSDQQMRSQLLTFFERYHRQKSKQDSRFLLISDILQHLVQSYAGDIHSDPSDHEKVLVSAQNWINKSWNPAALRPLASETLLRIATQSGAFTESTSLSEYRSERMNIPL